MSASEKLKQLQELPAPAFEPECKLYDALPQIVAVVEAAERNQPFVAEERFLNDDEVALKAALAALDEALTKTVLTDEEKKV